MTNTLKNSGKKCGYLVIQEVLSQGQITTLFPEVYMETGKMCGFLIV